MGVKTAQLLIEARFKRPVKELVHEMYYTKNMTLLQIADALCVSPGSIRLWMQQWEWPTRKRMVTEIPPINKEGG